MVVMPAVGLGVLAVFLAGAGLTYGVLGLIARRKGAGPALPGDRRPAARDRSAEDQRGQLALLGGGITAVLMILSLLVIPAQTAVVAWLVLTVLGILFGLVTLLLNEPSADVKPRRGHRSPPPSKAPPAPGEEPKPPASAGAPPRAQGERYRPPPPARVPPAAKEDPYRDLLAKAQYDKGLAGRLIEAERQRTPGAGWDDLCRSAIARLERDGP